MKKKASKKSVAKKAPRKRPLANKGTKRSPSGRHNFSNTKLAKQLKAHNQYMPHGYEIVTKIVDSKTKKIVR
ncbi:MAG TPA: hypothetical protein VK835_11755 [Bacteroidia bacterium]|jgi:hypothetical protein|nr:hypothetical protein [Bacteroidia bacterium]